MKLLVFFALVVVAAARPDDHYNSARFENLDVKEITGSKRLTCGYGRCFVGTGKCTAEGNDIKGMIDDGIKTQCGMCNTEKQHVQVAQFITALKEMCPQEFEILYKRGDPEGKSLEKLNEYIKKHAS